MHGSSPLIEASGKFRYTEIPFEGSSRLRLPVARGGSLPRACTKISRNTFNSALLGCVNKSYTMPKPVNPSNPCPGCGKPMPARLLAGLCPACLLAQEGRRLKTPRPPIFRAASDRGIGEAVSAARDSAAPGAGRHGRGLQGAAAALDRLVALKILPATEVAGGISRSVSREARALARLSHPNIVAVHDFGQAGGLHFFSWSTWMA